MTGNWGNGNGEDYILIRDEKATGTNGGTFTDSAWRTRDQNVIVEDVGGHASLSSNQITLAAGIYRFYITAPAFNVGSNKAKLINITDTIEIIGTSVNSDQGNFPTVISVISGRFIIAAPKVFEVQHQCQTTHAVSGFGNQSGFSVIEVYTNTEFFKGK